MGVNERLGVASHDIAQLCVQSGRLRRLMAHLLLYRAQADARFEQVCAVAMAQTVGGDGFVDVAASDDSLNGALHAAAVHRQAGSASVFNVLSTRKDERAVAMRGPILAVCRRTASRCAPS